MLLTFCDYKTKSMEYEKVMCHIQTEILLTSCDYNVTAPEASEDRMIYKSKNLTFCSKHEQFKFMGQYKNP
jgi:hypothetical protein